MKDEVNSTNGEGAFLIHPNAHAHGQCITEGKHNACDGAQAFAHVFGFFDALENAVVDVVEAVDGVITCAVCADVLQAQQAFF